MEINRQSYLDKLVKHQARMFEDWLRLAPGKSRTHKFKVAVGKK